MNSSIFAYNVSFKNIHVVCMCGCACTSVQELNLSLFLRRLREQSSYDPRVLFESRPGENTFIPLESFLPLIFESLPSKVVMPKSPEGGTLSEKEWCGHCLQSLEPAAGLWFCCIKYLLTTHSSYNHQPLVGMPEGKCFAF